MKKVVPMCDSYYVVCSVSPVTRWSKSVGGIVSKEDLKDYRQGTLGRKTGKLEQHDLKVCNSKKMM